MRRRVPGFLPAALLMSGTVLVALCGLDAAPLERAEIYFLDGARGMVERGDWLVPYYRGEPFFDKPPLTYWLMALAFDWLGLTARSARVVSALAAAGVVGVTVALGRRLYDLQTGLAAATVLGTTAAFLSFSRIAMSDMLLAFFTVLAAYLAVRAVPLEAAEPVSRTAIGALGVVFGLGFLTKGPIALLLPGFAAAILAWRRSRSAGDIPGGTAVLGALVAAVVGLSWYGAIYARLGAEPLVWFFWQENLQRFAGSRYDAGEPLWYYLVVYVAEGAPWSPLLPLAAWRALREPDEASRRVAGVLLAWAALMLVPLSLARGKIDYYLLPVYPALSLVLGRFLVALPWARLERTWVRLTLLLVAVAWALLPRVFHVMPEPWQPEPPVHAAFRALAWTAAAVVVLAALWLRRGVVLGAVATTTAVLAAAVGAWFVPPFRAGQPNAAIVWDVRRELKYRPDAGLAACGDPARAERDVLFELRLPATLRCDLWSPASSKRPYLLLLEPHERESLEASLPYLRTVAEYPYIPADALHVRSLFEDPQPGVLTLAATFRTDDPMAERKYVKERKRAIRELEELGLPVPE